MNDNPYSMPRQNGPARSVLPLPTKNSDNIWLAIDLAQLLVSLVAVLVGAVVFNALCRDLAPGFTLPTIALIANIQMPCLVFSLGICSNILIFFRTRLGLFLQFLRICLSVAWAVLLVPGNRDPAYAYTHISNLIGMSIIAIFSAAFIAYYIYIWRLTLRIGRTWNSDIG